MKKAYMFDSSSTQSYHKVLNYFYAIVKTEKFNSEVIRLRKLYSIPLDGYPKKGGYWNAAVIWENEGRENAYEIERELNKEIDQLCRSYSLHFITWSDVIHTYIVYNKIIILDYQPESALCMVTDAIEEEDDPYSEEVQKADNDVYPVTVRISPYASKRDIIDFINKSFPLIKEYQLRHKNNLVKIGRLRQRNNLISERNDYIFKLRRFKLKTIADKLHRKFGDLDLYDLDEGEIGKIISLEANRRKEV